MKPTDSMLAKLKSNCSSRLELSEALCDVIHNYLDKTVGEYEQTVISDGDINDTLLRVFDDLIVPQDPLVLSWLYFRGKEKNGLVNLEWGTTSEINNGQFILEKSLDGKTFETLTTMEAMNTSDNDHHYSFTDLAPFNNSFYRILYREINGAVSMYRTIRVDVASEGRSFAFVQGNNIHVIFHSGQTPQSGKIFIQGLDGRIIRSEEVGLFTGANALKIEKPVQTGIYIVSVKTGGGKTYSEKILVQN